MFCGNCGNKMSDGEIFCGNCGHRREVAATVQANANVHAAAPTPVNTEVARRAPMSPARKKQWIIGGAVAGVLVIAYVVARSMHGPSSPDALASAFAKALSDKSSSELKHLTDPAQKDLTDSKVLDAFVGSLNSDVASAYGNKLQQAVQDQSSQLNQALSQYFGSNDNSLHFIKKSSWLGDEWYIHMPTVTIHSDGIDGDQVSLSIGDYTFPGSDSGDLIPSIYNVKVTAKNDFGSETETQSMDLTNSAGKSELNPASLMKNTLQINFPDSNTPVTVTLNGKAVTAQNGQANVMPAPSNGKLAASATIAGVSVTGETTVQAGENSVDVSKVLSTGVAQTALTTLMAYDTSWTKAWNDKNASELTGVDPASSAYQNATTDMTNHTGQITLTKVAVDPDSVTINGNSISINASEFYTDQSGQQSEADWNYTLQQSGSGSGWWVESFYSSGENTTNAQNAIVKTP